MFWRPSLYKVMPFVFLPPTCTMIQSSFFPCCVFSYSRVCCLWTVRTCPYLFPSCRQILMRVWREELSAVELSAGPPGWDVGKQLTDWLCWPGHCRGALSWEREREMRNLQSDSAALWQLSHWSTGGHLLTDLFSLRIALVPSDQEFISIDVQRS